ncbi:MAG TPA: NAD(P)-dependent oxidoreductase [Planctomycetaceae bacterium]|nr:NAD(P)-dependent oxidoreductase [Planctomycetaceae bacterium]
MTDPSVANRNRFADESVPTSTGQLDQLISQPDEHAITAVDSMPGDFVVLGAGGKMGLHLCQMLRRSLSQLGRRDQVFAVSRFSSDNATRRFSDHDIRTIAADLSDPAVYSRLPDSPNVFYLAGVKFGTASSPDLLDRMNVQAPRLAADHFRSSKIVALSTGCVYSFTSPESDGSTETCPTDPPGQYALSCLGREREFIDASNRHNTACTLVRLNYSVELRYGVLVDIAEKVFHGRPVNVDTGYANVIWQGDAISQIIRCLTLTQSPPAIINITGSQVLRVRDIAHRFAAIFDKPTMIEGSEAPTAWLSNNARSVELFGQPPTSVDTMIRRIAKWVSAGGETLGKPTHFENRDGAY